MHIVILDRFSRVALPKVQLAEVLEVELTCRPRQLY